MTFQIGDKVEIVNYGSLLYETVNGVLVSYDMMPDLVGKQALIRTIMHLQGKYYYGLEGVSKSAWYNENQLKLVN